MSTPLAVSPGQLTPGLYLTVDLLAGTASPNVGQLRVAIVSPRSSAGDLGIETEVRAGSGADSAATAFGTGTPGHLAAKLLYAKFPAAVVDFVAATAGAGSATLNVTLSGSVSSNNAIDWDIMGREFQVSWLVGETADAVKTKCINAINQRTDELAVTATSGGTGIVTLTAKLAGNWGEDILVRAKLNLTQTGTEAVAGAATHTPLAGATTDPDLTNALALMVGREYHFILPCLSNQDIANTATANNLSRVVAHIDAYDQGLGAKLQQVVAGFTGTIAQGIASTVHANGGKNATFGEVICCVAGRGLPCELGGREVGGRLAAEMDDPAANRIGELLDGYIGAFDKVAEQPTLAESESALGGGLALVGYTAQDLEVLIRPVTTHSQTSAGGPDRRLLDVQNVSATYIVARDLRDNLPLEFPKAKITKDTLPGEDPPPKGVIEERDIKGWIISRLRFWQVEGVVTQASVDASIADGTLIVEVNASDATQVDIVVPFKIVPPLAKFGVVVQRLPN